MVEGPPNTHPGQGTANRRFFFANAMLELLWVYDATEAATGPACRFRFPERASDPAASPFGLIFRRTDEACLDSPFPGWKYEPDYLDPPLYLHVGDNSENILEPLCVYMPLQSRLRQRTIQDRLPRLATFGSHPPVKTHQKSYRKLRG